jgi:hypothetical protein
MLSDTPERDVVHQRRKFSSFRSTRPNGGSQNFLAGFDSSRFRKGFYRTGKLLLYLGLLIEALYFILLCIMHSETRNAFVSLDIAMSGYASPQLEGKHPRDWPNPSLFFLFSTAVPHYLLFSFDQSGSKRCKPIFQRILPNINSFNSTDDALLESLFSYEEPSEYFSSSVRSLAKEMPKMRGKLCSNASSEWILFTTFENSNIRRSVSDSMPSVFSQNLDQHFEQDGHVVVSRIDYLDQKQRCRPFDFNQCSLNGSSIHYPKIFELEKQEPVW